MLNSFIKRWLTGLILAGLIFVIIVFTAPIVLTIVIAIFAVGGMWEYNNIVSGKGISREKIEGAIFAAVIPFLFLFGNSQLILAVLAFSILIIFILFLGSIKEDKFDVISVAKVIFGIMYIPFLISHFILLRIIDQGIMWVLFVLVLAFAGDITALYIGKYFGKHKLIPLISPGKTVEGTIGLVFGKYHCLFDFRLFHFPSNFINKNWNSCFCRKHYRTIG